MLWMSKTESSAAAESARGVEGFLPLALGVIPASPMPVFTPWASGVGEMGYKMGVSEQNGGKGI
jgi:hypothetical protein